MSVINFCKGESEFGGTEHSLRDNENRKGPWLSPSNLRIGWGVTSPRPYPSSPWATPRVGTQSNPTPRQKDSPWCCAYLSRG